MTTPTYATNAQIDEAALELIRCNGPICDAAIAANLSALFVLRPGRHSVGESLKSLRHANRSCQRLKQRGLVKFDKGWRVAK